MKAFKITASITTLTGGNGWNVYGEPKVSSKEFYHLTEAGAREHITQYISRCAKSGIELNIKNDNIDYINKHWRGDNHKSGSTYDVYLEEIDIKED